MNKLTSVAAGLCAVIIICTGCSQKTIDSAQQDANNDASKVHTAVDQAAAQVKPDVDSLGVGARVDTAIAANANLPKTIRVDASPNGVTLKGSVKTAAQKNLAGQVAKDTLGPGKTVANDIAVERH